MSLQNNHDWHAAIGRLAAMPTREAFIQVVQLFIRSLPIEQQEGVYESLMIACGGNVGPYSINYSGQTASHDLRDTQLLANGVQPSIHTYIGNVNIQMPSSPVAPPYSPLTPSISSLTTEDTVRAPETSTSANAEGHPEQQYAYDHSAQGTEAQQNEELEQAAQALLAACADVSSNVGEHGDDEHQELGYVENAQALEGAKLSEDEWEAVEGLFGLSRSFQGHYRMSTA